MSFSDNSPTNLHHSTSHFQFLEKLVRHTIAGEPLAQTLALALKAAATLTSANQARLILEQASELSTFTHPPAQTDLSASDAKIHQYCQSEGTLEVANLAQSNALELPELSGLFTGLLAFSLPLPKNQRGTLWLAFDHTLQLDASQREFLQLLILQTAAAINQAYIEANAQRGNEQLTALLANDAEPIVMVDTKAHIQVFNSAAEHLFQTNAQAAIGQLFESIVENQGLRDLIQAGTDTSEHIEFTSDDNRTFSPHVSEVRATDGTLRGWLLVMREVTRFKRLSENLSTFLHTVSHDIRSPMTAAKGFVDMLTMVGPVTEKQEKFIEKISTSINDMTNLVEKVLDAGRLDPEMDAYEIRREPCDPAALVKKVVSTLSPMAANKGILLSAEVSDNVPIMNIDEMMTERALLNLVENAIKYTPDGGHVWVRSEVLDNQLRLSVSDDGLGIAPADQARLFERGERVRRQEHKAIRGSGLGLFIVRNVARKHNGIANLESEIGKGSTFSISIPLTGKNLVAGNH